MFSLAVQASNLERRQSELKNIQQQISKQQNTLQSTSNHRKKLKRLLKKDEQAIARVAKKLNATQKSLANIDKELSSIKTKQTVLTNQKKSQQRVLSKQLSSAYLNGNHDYTKMLLSQQDPAVIERTLVYYQYLNKARVNAINNLKNTINELDVLAITETQRKTELTALLLTQQTQADSLNKEKLQRARTFKQLQQTLTSKNAQLEELQIEEASIKQLLKKAEQAAKNNSLMLGLHRNKQKMDWPTAGKLVEKFGSSRAGGVHWKGVIIAAPEGNNINAIAPGKVIYADWLKGFGMVIVIDHGKGYMSLYGHAQTLLKAVGTKVEAGDNIALVGRSGGQVNSGLYFEIRHKGQAVDPAKYCR